MKKVLFLCILFLIMAGSATADQVQWKAADGGNDHWYEVVRYDLEVGDYLPWEIADRTALFADGYLATITSQAENDFVWGRASLDVDSSGLWLGGYQTDKNAEPDGHWAWSNGEAWGYTNWATSPFNEPNNGMLGTQDYLHFWPSDGKWDDMENGRYMAGFIAEYDSVPEPGTLLLLGIGLFGLAGISRRRFKK